LLLWQLMWVTSKERKHGVVSAWEQMLNVWFEKLCYAMVKL
jgi:hypothetical protein